MLFTFSEIRRTVSFLFRRWRHKNVPRFKTHVQNNCFSSLNFLVWWLSRWRHLASTLKPWPNDINTSTQHIPTMLAQHLQAPAKRLQHLKGTDRNIVAGNILDAFGHPVATCCDMFELKIELVYLPGRNIVARTWPNYYNIMQHPEKLLEKFDHFQIWTNNTQHVATGWPNVRNMMRATMLP